MILEHFLYYLLPNLLIAAALVPIIGIGIAIVVELRRCRVAIQGVGPALANQTEAIRQLGAQREQSTIVDRPPSGRVPDATPKADRNVTLAEPQSSTPTPAATEDLQRSPADIWQGILKPKDSGSARGARPARVQPPPPPLLNHDRRPVEDPAVALWREQAARWDAWAHDVRATELRELRLGDIRNDFLRAIEVMSDGIPEGKMIFNQIMFGGFTPVFRATAFIHEFYAENEIVKPVRKLIFDSCSFIEGRLRQHQYEPIVPTLLAHPDATSCDATAPGSIKIVDPAIRRRGYLEYVAHQRNGDASPRLVGDVARIGYRDFSGKIRTRARAEVVTLDWAHPGGSP